MATTTWGRDPADRIQTWASGEAHFIFHDASGQTHFLNELAARILERIEQRAQTADDIVRFIIEAYDVEASDVLVESVADTLHILDRLGLIAPRQP